VTSKKLRHLINHFYKPQYRSSQQEVIIGLQETYIESKSLVNLLWRGNCHITSGNGHSHGCITLLSSNLNVIAVREISDRAHVLVLQNSADAKPSYILANIYAPNPNTREKIEFYNEVLDTIYEFEETYECSNVLLLGDFNVVFNTFEAKNRNFSRQERNVASAINSLFVAGNLSDVWQRSDQKQEFTDFTWRRPGTNIFSCIDRILYSQPKLKLIKIETNWSLSFSDHTAVEATSMKNDSCKQQRSKITRLDPSLLSNERIKSSIVTEIYDLMRQAPEDWNPHTKLEYFKMCIRSTAERAQAERKRAEKSEEDFLNEELEIRITALSEESTPERDKAVLIEHIEDLRARKSILVEEKGARLAERLGTKWYNEGEKSTQVFPTTTKS